MKNEKLKEKNGNIYFPLIIFLLFCTVLFIACSNVNELPGLSDQVRPGYGTIRISTEDEAARTIFPSTDFKRYAYHFTKMTDDTADSEPIGVAETVIPENEVFTLEVGYYTVQVDAFHADDASVPMASGVSEVFYVGPGNNGTIIVSLALNPEFEDETQGTFTYIIKFPQGAQIVSLTLEQLTGMDNNSVVELNYELLSGDGGGDTITKTILLDSGYYLLNIRVEIDGKYAGIIETVHVYPASTTVLEVIFNADGLVTTAIYGIELSESGTYTFPGAIQGYEIQDVLTVTIDNIGNQATGKLAVTLSGDDAGGFVLSEILFESIGVNSSDVFAIEPNTGLSAGTYTAIVIVSGSNGISEQFNVSFTVTDPGAPLFEVMDNNKTYGDTQEVIVDYANGITPAQAGEFTVYYTGISGTNYAQNTTAPVNVGIYNITIDTTGGSTYNPVSGQSVGTLTINPKNLTITNFNISKDYDGTTTVTNFGTPSFSGLVYGETATVDTSGVTAIYEQETVGANLNVNYAGLLGMTGGTASTSNYQITQPDDLTGTITPASPGSPGMLTENSKTHNSVTLDAPTGIDPLFMLEYGRNTVNNATNATWQDGLVFTDLSAGTPYYFFARYKADPAKNNVSAASSSLTVITLQTVSQDRIEYYWVDEHGSLVTTSGKETSVAAGETLIITAQSTGYVVKQWYLNGLNTGQNGNTYNFSSTTPGLHTVSLFVEKDGKLYNTNIIITVNDAAIFDPVIFYEDFEGTSSFALINGSYTNQWRVGTATAYAGTRSAYISNDSGSSNSYTITSSSTVHMYRDVTFPVSNEPYTLSFYWKCQGEGTSTLYDYLRVFLVNTTVTPTAGSTSSLGTALGTYNLGGTGWNQANINIPASNSGTTMRLVFTWVNDSSQGTQPPAAVDNIELRMN